MTWHEGVRRLSREEFLQWRKVSETFALVGKVTDGFAADILSLLQRGELVAAANASWSEGDANHSADPRVIQGDWWGRMAAGNPHGVATFLKSGKITLFIPDASSAAIWPVTFTDTRLDPAGLERIPSPKPRDPPPVPASNVPSVPPPLLATASAGDIDVGEFGRWLTVREVVAEFSEDRISQDVWLPRLLKRLTDGEVRAAVETLTATQEGASEDETYQRIQQWVWVTADIGKAFFQLGEADAVLPHASKRRNINFTLRGIRLSDLDMSRMLGRAVTSETAVLPFDGEPGQPAPPKTAIAAQPARSSGISAKVATTAKPTDSQVKKWLERHEAKFPGQVHSVLTVAFNRENPNFSVGKRQLYRVMTKVRGKLSVGNPRISRPRAGN